MSLIDKIKLDDFLKKNKYISIKPSSFDGLVLEGKFLFNAKTDGFRQINDFYILKIIVSNDFPSSVPTVIEIGNKIPKKEYFHINSDNTLCLGAPLKLLELLNKEPTLEGFIKYCLVPYLYAISLKIQDGIDLVFDELAHGNEGIFSEYSNIFGIKDENSIKQIIKMLSLKKRVANKEPCPCNCGQRLGKCKNKLNQKLNRFRYYASRSWYINYFKNSFSG
ncbi:hypothetical protein [Aliarcobacter butzleri]|uniref:hypothetical protein n=1 Tax=Aliarcobacter butzleri TaxID=28197 RepID=UPI002B250E29|nr:hypothetical protein [Aliarcobacter butzleri]